MGLALQALNGKEMKLDHKLKNKSGSRAQGSKWKRNDSGSRWKTTLGRELWALKGKEMTLSH